MNLSNGGEIVEVLKRTRPDVVLYAVSMRSAESCEENPQKADTIHFRAATVFLKLSPYPLRFVYYSVDEVFGLSSPTNPAGFGERDLTMPTSVLSKTRAAGEVATLSQVRSCAVIRLGDVYGEDFRPGSHLCANWVGIVSTKLVKGETVTLPRDLMRTPVYVGDVVRATHKLLGDFPLGSTTEAYHWGGPTGCSPYDLALEMTSRLGWDAARIKPGSSVKGKTARPIDARLNSKKFAERFGFHFQSPVDGVHELTERLRLGQTSHWP